MILFDSHAHLLDEAFDGDRDAMISLFPSHNIMGIIECATDAKDIFLAVELAKKYERIYAAVGVHPHSAEEYSNTLEEQIALLSKEKKVVAIGEIGLDYHYDFAPRDLQKQVLQKQLRLAKKCELPIILHAREATEDTLAILKEEQAYYGVVHCFSGSAETAAVLLEKGMYLGFGGSLTFKNAKKTVEVAKMVPMDRFLIETDSPYLSPVPLRGTVNTPKNVELVIEKMAEIKGISANEIAKQAYQNAKKLFGLE